MNNTYSHLVENIKQLARDAKLRPNSNKSKKARSILGKIIPDSKIPWKHISHHQTLSKLAHVFDYKSWKEYVLFLKNYDRTLEQKYPLLADDPFRDDKISYNLYLNILKNSIHFKNWSEYLKFYKANYPSDRVEASNIKIFGANLNPWHFLEKNISFKEYIELEKSIKKFGYFSGDLHWLFLLIVILLYVILVTLDLEMQYS